MMKMNLLAPRYKGDLYPCGSDCSVPLGPVAPILRAAMARADVDHIIMWLEREKGA